jgi:UDP-hydrolysing UDP-N-acetyl-D-glucosamine 2-epimerase
MHSVTLESEESKNQVIPVLKSLSKIPKNIKIIATYPNNDAGGRSIIKEFKAFDKEHKNFTLVPSLGRRRFHGMLGLNKIMDVTMIGNSSAGIKETPIFKCPSINIGSRQQGRLRSTNIIDAGYNQKEILSAIKKSLNKNFRRSCRHCKNPYGKGRAGEVITSVLSEVPIDRKLLIKRMTY